MFFFFASSIRVKVTKACFHGGVGCSTALSTTASSGRNRECEMMQKQGVRRTEVRITTMFQMVVVVGSSHYKITYYTKRQAFDNKWFCISKITKIKNFLFYLTRSQRVGNLPTLLLCLETFKVCKNKVFREKWIFQM